MRQLSEREVVQFLDRLFAWGQGYNVPTPFANRTSAVGALLSVLDQAADSDARRVVCVHDALGSGKTFLVNHALSQGKAAGVQLRLADVNLAERLSEPNPAPYAALQIIDELDIKAGSDVWEASLKAMEEYSSRAGGTLLLIGDATLKCDYVKARLSAIAPPEYVELEPLTQPFFELALNARVTSCFGVDEVEKFIDPRFLDALVPRWPVTPATFRSTFQVLALIGQQMIGTDRPCLIGHPQLIRWLETQRGPSGRRVRQAAARIVEFTKGRGADVEPLTDETLAPIFELDPYSADYRSLADGLVNAKALFSLGVPTLTPDGEYERFPGPFVPGERACLEAFALA